MRELLEPQVLTQPGCTRLADVLTDDALGMDRTEAGEGLKARSASQRTTAIDTKSLSDRRA
jgi:hypothetical protein